MGGWIDMFRSLGESLLEVLRAELQTLQEDLTRSGRQLKGVLAYVGAALILTFWLAGVLFAFSIAAVIAVLSIWLRPWPAALVGLLLIAVVAACLIAFLALLAKRKLKKVENPVETFRRHADDHLDWWQNNLLRENRPLDVEPTAGLPGGLYDEEEDLP